jgi:hypothetical protein
LQKVICHLFVGHENNRCHLSINLVPTPSASRAATSRTG